MSMLKIAGKGLDGLAKALRTDNEGRAEVYINPKNRNFYEGGYETLAAGESFQVYENSVHSELRYMEFSTNDIRTQLIISYKSGSSYLPVGQIMRDGSNVAGFYVSQIVNEGSSMFKIMSYEEGAYKFALNIPMEFSEGFKVEMKNTNTEVKDINVACRMFGVEGID